MTQQEAERWLPYLSYIEALAKGKTIQNNESGEWIEYPCPTFNSPPENYRIKPEPREF